MICFRPAAWVWWLAAAATVMVFLILPFETPDEVAHLNYVNFLATRHELPNQLDPTKTVQDEGWQPPLYYLIEATLLSLFTADNEIHYSLVNNPVSDYWGGSEHRVPRYDHRFSIFGADSDRRAYYMLRLATVLMAVGVVVVSLKMALLRFPDDYRRWMAMILIATLPQFTFISASINNDTAANLCAALTTLQLILLYRDPLPRNFVLTGLWLGLGLMCKSVVVVLIPAVILAVWLVVKEKRISLRAGLRWSCLLLGMVVLFGGFHYLRAAILYGDPTLTRVTTGIPNGDSEFTVPWAPYFWNRYLPYLGVSFVATFGWMSLRLPMPLYLVHVAVAAMATLGIYRLVRSKQLGGMDKLLLTIGLSNLIGAIYWIIRCGQPQGRYLFPALPAVALLASGGIDTFRERILPRVSPRLFYSLLTVGLIGVEVFAFGWLGAHNA